MKTQLSLSIDVEVLTLIKDKHINLSALVEGILKNELQTVDKKDKEIEMKIINAKLISKVTELENKVKELETKLEKNKNGRRIVLC